MKFIYQYCAFNEKYFSLFFRSLKRLMILKVYKQLKFLKS